MANIDIVQDKKIATIIGLLAALSGITAFLIYIENRKHNVIKAEILELDKSIKELQLAKLKKT